MPAPAHPDSASDTDERGAGLALLPVAATLNYYALPDSLQNQPLVQFAPQLIGYLAFALWAAHNDSVVARLGLSPSNLRSGARLGLITGVTLGCLNALIILALVPWLGWDITFLTQTPHARVPVVVMVPWFVSMIALMVELNFRGFLLGRLAALESNFWRLRMLQRLSPLALLTSALVFAFDPFMVVTFRHLHWIALWDGFVWGLLWLLARNLYATIVAHAVEVILVYSAVRAALMG
ncbi:MAG TPA: CPBP family glutamic-type intramembrane protease [Nitrospira sp.]|nr:CPBP family glutamic-type intramembrane protease [Nitrospira sp.]